MVIRGREEVDWEEEDITAAPHLPLLFLSFLLLFVSLSSYCFYYSPFVLLSALYASTSVSLSLSSISYRLCPFKHTPVPLFFCAWSSSTLPHVAYVRDGLLVLVAVIGFVLATWTTHRIALYSIGSGSVLSRYSRCVWSALQRVSDSLMLSLKLLISC